MNKLYQYTSTHCILVRQCWLLGWAASRVTYPWPALSIITLLDLQKKFSSNCSVSISPPLMSDLLRIHLRGEVCALWLVSARPAAGQGHRCLAATADAVSCILQRTRCSWQWYIAIWKPAIIIKTHSLAVLARGQCTVAGRSPRNVKELLFWSQCFVFYEAKTIVSDSRSPHTADNRQGLPLACSSDLSGERDVRWPWLDRVDLKSGWNDGKQVHDGPKPIWCTSIWESAIRPRNSMGTKLYASYYLTMTSRTLP